MLPILNKVKLGTHSGERPPAAVEFAAGGVLAAALRGPGQPPDYAYQSIPAGALVAGIGEPNLRAPEAIASALRLALGQVAPRSRAVTLVIPDTAVRVFVLDFDTFSSKPEEAYPVLRFRLRRIVPFDVEHAGLSYQILSESMTECRVLVAVIPGPILQEYEAAVQAAGYESGAVLCSSLASLAAIDTLDAVLTANLSGLALTTTITNSTDLLLYRTLDLPEDASLRSAEVRRSIAVAAAYYEDKLHVRANRLLYSGEGSAEAFARMIGNAQLTVADLAPRPESGVATAWGDMSTAGVAGALAEAH
jgi:type IV pilus assembly protein PilM